MPNTFYDDPRWQAGDDRIRFTQIGDAVRGRVTDMKWVRMNTDDVPIATLADVTAKQEGREVTYKTADVSLGLTHLQAAWNQEKPDIGDTVQIVYVESRNVGQPQPQKRFAFEVQKPIPSAAPVQGQQTDIFTR